MVAGRRKGRSVVGSPVPKRDLWTCLFLLMGLQASSLLAPFVLHAQDTSKDNVISEDVNLLVLPVAVTDRAGHFVSGLEASNFRVYEEGRLQKITLFHHEDIPVTIGLVVDHSGSMVAKQLQVIEGAQAFVHASNPQNREFVVDFGNTVSFALPPNVPFTNDVEQLTAALSTPSASGKTALYDAVVAALKHVREDSNQKRVLILISDGGDNASQHTFAQALRLAQAGNVVIYAIGLLDELSADQNPNVLKKLTAETGGQAYFPNSLAEIVSLCQQIAADIRQQYTLGYSPLDPNRSGYRKIRVNVTAPGRGKLFVRTRAGYFVPANTSFNATAADERGL
jgi:Ca-activated chloride channel family protein